MNSILAGYVAFLLTVYAVVRIMQTRHWPHARALIVLLYLTAVVPLLYLTALLAGFQESWLEYAS